MHLFLLTVLLAQQVSYVSTDYKYDYMRSGKHVWGSFPHVDIEETETSITVRNKIQSLGAHEFSRYKHLEEVSLYNNLLKAISETAFNGTEISILDLTHNELEKVPAHALQPISTTLRELSLDRNPIQVVQYSDFTGLQQLVKLSLKDTQLTQVPAKAMLPVIETLNILNLGVNKFTNLVGVKTLLMASNSLTINLNQVKPNFGFGLLPNLGRAMCRDGVKRMLLNLNGVRKTMSLSYITK